ncbi:hypothetical protein GYMLUDRAFT_200226 [Collybiopsis luxurians FD-317 M1]|uniref:Cytochrome P450 n=1 Tax=Collybiopsis luxurians FD-317 M1 TaxID=944289 RepID=A0A0D0BYL6_9AGAR|nr:hypothetical protein GYMLUDRAFT_200226 [Collybiopsis luxurians FD-317 M1]
MDPITFTLIISAFTVAYVIYKAQRRSVLDRIAGPVPKSFLVGSMADLMQNQAGLTEFSWQEAYGDIVKFKGPLGTDRLLISDPKALQHILQTSGYRWGKSPERKELSRMISGKNLAWADGDGHRRQRKVMLPGFGAPEARSFLPIFFSCAATMARRWSDILSNSEDQSHVINIPVWVSRATLDAIGQAAFDYDFGATEDHDNELGKAYQNFLMKVLGSPSKAALVILELFRFIPPSVLEFLNEHNPSPRVAHARRVAKIAREVAEQLVSEKSDALLKGRSKNDIMSLLVKANAGENPKAQLTEEELFSQMRAILVAGQETTSSTINWLLYELVRNTKLQDKLRAEIHAAQRVAALRGDSELNIHDLGGMPLLGATVKETLRFHPVALHVWRAAREDDILPLSTPITTTTGEILTEVPISKGTRVVLSIPVYNRNKAIFGEDAHMFNPYRWLEPNHVTKGVSLGPYANLATFSAGIRVCIGWRFAVIELQAFIVELLSNFEFSKTPKIDKIRREAAVAMVPTVEGEIEQGCQLPLRVTFAKKGEE